MQSDNVLKLFPINVILDRGNILLTPNTNNKHTPKDTSIINKTSKVFYKHSEVVTNYRVIASK